MDVTVVSHQAYLIDGRGVLHIVDVSQPQTPTPLGSFEPQTNYLVNRIEVIGDRAYLYDQFGGAQIITLDIANPQAPTLLGVYQANGRIQALAGNQGETTPIYCYFLDDYGAVRIVDLSNPTAPQEVGFYRFSARLITSSLSPTMPARYVWPM